MAFLQAEEFEDKWFFGYIGGVAYNQAFGGEFADARFVTTKGKSFVEAAVELAFQFANGPTLLGGLDFVETAFVRVFDCKKKNLVSPTKTELAR